MKPYVKQFERNDCAGIYVGNDLGSVGLVAQNGVQPFLVIWGTGKNVPALALAAEGDHGVTVQVPGPDDSVWHLQQFSLATLIEAARKLTEMPVI